MKKTNAIRGHQGDVGFQSIAAIPNNAKKIQNRPIALGEHSGHMHILTGDVQLFEVGGSIIAAVGSDGARLQHVHERNFNANLWRTTKELPKADHHSHLLPEGIYSFWIQNSYNPYSRLMEAVVD